MRRTGGGDLAAHLAHELRAGHEQQDRPLERTQAEPGRQGVQRRGPDGAVGRAGLLAAEPAADHGELGEQRIARVDRGRFLDDGSGGHGSVNDGKP